MADLSAPDLALAAAGGDEPTVTLAGREFRVAEKIGGLALMRFAAFAKKGVDSSSLNGLAAMYDLLRAVVHPDAWGAFEEHADDQRVTADDLMQAVFDAMEAIADRPTSRPSASPAGPSTTSTSSSADSSSRVIAELEAKGRPDQAQIVYLADVSRRSA